MENLVDKSDKHFKLKFQFHVSCATLLIVHHQLLCLFSSILSLSVSQLITTIHLYSSHTDHMVSTWRAVTIFYLYFYLWVLCLTGPLQALNTFLLFKKLSLGLSLWPFQLKWKKKKEKENWPSFQKSIKNVFVVLGNILPINNKDSNILRPTLIEHSPNSFTIIQTDIYLHYKAL